MRAAPPVGLCCDGGLAWRALQSVLPGLAAAVMTGWIGAHAGWPVARWLPLALLTGTAAGLLAWRLARPRQTELRWDGQAWSADGTKGRLDVMLDLGGWLLVRLRPRSPGAVRWVAVSAAEAGGQLHALRAALYSRPSEAAPHVRVPGQTPD
jgi:hypothetical protein